MGGVPKRIENFRKRQRKQQEYEKLQKLRSSDSSTTDPVYGGAGSPVVDIYSRESKDYSQMTTFQMILARTKDISLKLKDFLLYDLLRVNQVQYSKYGKYLLTKNAFIVYGLIVAIVSIYFIISTVGASRERANLIREANDQLVIIKDDIDTLEASPVFATRSTITTSQRQQALERIQEVEAKFNSGLDILPEDEIASERIRLENLRDQALSVVEAEPQMLLDVSNIYEGTISDILTDGQNVYITDPLTGQIYRQPIRGGNSEIVASSVESPQSLSLDNDGSLVVTKDVGSAVAIIDPVSGEAREIPGLSTASFEQVAESAIYLETNGLYTVGAGLNEISLSDRVGQSYSVPTVRHQGATPAPFIDLAIVNARIMALASGEGLVRVDVPNSRVEALPEIVSSVNTASAFGIDNEYVYLADNINDRILIFTLTKGSLPVFEFTAQIPLSGIDGEVVEVSTGQSLNSILIATSTKVYAIAKPASL